MIGDEVLADHAASRAHFWLVFVYFFWNGGSVGSDTGADVYDLVCEYFGLFAGE